MADKIKRGPPQVVRVQCDGSEDVLQEAYVEGEEGLKTLRRQPEAAKEITGPGSR